MLFKKIISKEGWELRLHEEHEIFSIPIFQELNFDEAIDVSYTDLYMLAFNNTEYDLLSKDEVVSHLELLDMICFVNKQKELLDYAIKEYNEELDKWKNFINPSIIEIFPEYLIKFPDIIDDNLEAFSKLNDYDDFKREKLLEYAHNNNFEAFSLLFNKSLVNNRFLKNLFKYGVEFVEIIIDKGFNNWGQGMKCAARGGNKELVDFFIKKGANNWNNALKTAAKGGHKDLVLLFIEKGAKYWNWGMQSAACGGHKEIVDFFIDKGADYWDWGIYGAAKGGHKELVLFFIEKGTDDWNLGMLGATKGGHKELVDLFIEKGANYWNLGMEGAALGGHKDLVLFFIEKGANDWYRGMNGAKRGGHKELVEFFNKKLNNL